jgi:hypothetical protein
VVKEEWHQGELFLRVGFIVTNLSRNSEAVVKFYNGRGTAKPNLKTPMGSCSLAGRALAMGAGCFIWEISALDWDGTWTMHL